MNTFAKDKTMEDRLIEQADMINAEMQLLINNAKALGGFSPDEEKQLDDLKKQREHIYARVERARSDAAMNQAMKEKTGGLAFMPSDGQAVTGIPRGGSSFMRQLAQTPFAKFLQEHRGRLSASGAAWTTPTLELIAFAGGQDLLAIDESSGSGGALVVPDYIPGIVELATRALVVADLMGSGTTDSNSVTFMAEKTITNAAAPVAPGALKPQSDIVFEAKTTPVRKIATWVEIVSELLVAVQLNVPNGSDAG